MQTPKEKMIELAKKFDGNYRVYSQTVEVVTASGVFVQLYPKGVDIWAKAFNEGREIYNKKVV